MTQKKQKPNQTRAIPTRDLPERDRSSFTATEQLRRLHPNVKPEHLDLALERMQQFGCPDGENEIDYFGKVLAAVIIDEAIGKRGEKHEHP